MANRSGVTTFSDMPIPETMKARVIGDPDGLKLVDKPVLMLEQAQISIRIDAVAICATDLEII